MGQTKKHPSKATVANQTDHARGLDIRRHVAIFCSPSNRGISESRLDGRNAGLNAGNLALRYPPQSRKSGADSMKRLILTAATTALALSFSACADRNNPRRRPVPGPKPPPYETTYEPDTAPPDSRSEERKRTELEE